MRIIINRKLLKGKKSEIYFGKMEKGGGVLFKMTLVSAILKWQYQFNISFHCRFSHSEKQDRVFLTRYRVKRVIKTCLKRK